MEKESDCHSSNLREVLHGKYLRILWDDHDIKLFNEELSEYFDDQRSNGYPEVGREFVRKGKKALEEMTKYHYELVHMMEIEMFQIEEIDKLKEMVCESSEKVGVKVGIRKNLESIVADLRYQLKNAQEENSGRKDVLESRDTELQGANDGSKEKKLVYLNLMKEALEAKSEVAKEVLDEIEKIAVDNSRMQKAVDTASKTTKELKEALDRTSQVLKDTTA